MTTSPLPTATQIGQALVDALQASPHQDVALALALPEAMPVSEAVMFLSGSQDKKSH